MYGDPLQIKSDQLMSVLKPNRETETTSSQLTSWVNRLLPLDFEEITNAAGRTLGNADCKTIKNMKDLSLKPKTVD